MQDAGQSQKELLARLAAASAGQPPAGANWATQGLPLAGQLGAQLGTMGGLQAGMLFQQPGQLQASGVNSLAALSQLLRDQQQQQPQNQAPVDMSSFLSNIHALQMASGHQQGPPVVTLPPSLGLQGMQQNSANAAAQLLSNPNFKSLLAQGVAGNAFNVQQQANSLALQLQQQKAIQAAQQAAAFQQAQMQSPVLSPPPQQPPTPRMNSAVPAQPAPAKAEPSLPTAGVISSPYATFRDISRPRAVEHGCPHLFGLFSELSTRPHEGKRTRKQDLMDDYVSCVRYTLTWKYRSELQAGIESRGGSARRKRGGSAEELEEDVRMTDEQTDDKETLDALDGMLENLKTPSCSTCRVTVARVHACLGCTAFGCCPIGLSDSHIKTHMEKSGHDFAMDLSTHALYCRQCRDYVYDVEFERALVIERVAMSETVSFLLASANSQPPANRDTPLSPSASRKALAPLIGTKRERYAPPPLPTTSSLQSIRQHFKLPIAGCPRGLRGLRNLGSTCFMNVVLQAVVHNPIMRSWWLGDGHNSRLCPRGRGPGGVCMACQVDTLFNQFYSGLKSPFGPAAFLHALWLSQSHLAGYSQQDAHEFFIALLNQLHMDLATDHQHPHEMGCRCIVHQSFGGVLQSDVRCEKCGNVTTAWDPILDLSLDLKGITRHAPLVEDLTGASPSVTAPPLTLSECLDRFTHPERLSSGSYTCRSCGSHNGSATKQMSVRTLPQVLSIQFKRFEHRFGVVGGAAGKPAKVTGEGRKVETFVQVPVQLDMQGYTSEGVHKRRALSDAIQSQLGSPVVSPGLMSPTQSSASLAAWAASANNVDEDPVKVHPDPGFQYTLFAVIEHIGKLDSGHYRAYVKSRGQWFAFDDHVVTVISQKAVLECNVYMAFYSKDAFDFGEEPLPPKPVLSPLQQLLPSAQQPIVIDDEPHPSAPMLGPPPAGGTRGSTKTGAAATKAGETPTKVANGNGFAGKTIPNLNTFMPGLNMSPPPTGTFSPSQPGTPPAGRLVNRSPSITPPSSAQQLLRTPGIGPPATRSGRSSPAPGGRTGTASSPGIPVTRQF